MRDLGDARDLGWDYWKEKPDQGRYYQQHCRRNRPPDPATFISWRRGDGRNRDTHSVRRAIPLQPLQVGADFSRALIADLAVLLQSLIDNVFKSRGKIGVEALQRSGLLVEDGIEDRGRGVSAKGQGSSLLG